MEIPCEQRRDDAQPAGRRVEAQSRICSEIVKETGVDINLTCSKTNTLTIVLSGQPEKVAVAKRSLIAELQQQVSPLLTLSPVYSRNRFTSSCIFTVASVMRLVNLPPAVH